MKLLTYANEQPAGVFYHYCPGCDQLHRITTLEPNTNGAKWSFNGDRNRPTFSPSINIIGLCHYFITDGMIIFCSDSKHKLAGTTVELPDIPPYYKTDE